MAECPLIIIETMVGVVEFAVNDSWFHLAVGPSMEELKSVLVGIRMLRRVPSSREGSSEISEQSNGDIGSSCEGGLRSDMWNKRESE
jgi:hypothetical protein